MLVELFSRMQDSHNSIKNYCKNPDLVFCKPFNIFFLVLVNETPFYQSLIFGKFTQRITLYIWYFLRQFNIFSFLYLVGFCKKYSFTKNGPCQNGGELIGTNDLAIDAICTCKEGYYGDFCVYYKKVQLIVYDY